VVARSFPKTALITGANRGLGRAVAEALRARGLEVIATSRDGSTGTQLDVTSGFTIATLAHELAERVQRGEPALDLLIQNAAISDGELRSILQTNFFGPLHVTGALAPVLNDGAHVVMVSSGMGELAGASSGLGAALLSDALTGAALRAHIDQLLDGSTRADWPANPYSASKLALGALTRVLARELAPRHIRVNAVCPGWVRTEMGGSGAPRSLEQGTASILATALLTDDTTGALFRDGERIAW
jgi:NAD(P)-dependent dehydrogenase (short-subunit alcohol dehydrogenase family)